MLLEVRNITKSFDGIKAVDGVSFSLDPSQGLCFLIGPNGSGKTTILDLITGNLRPDEGEVLFEGYPISGLSPYKIAAKGVARTFQQGRLFYQLSLLDNLLLAASNGLENPRSLLSLRWRREERLLREKAMKILLSLGLMEDRGKRAEELSFGQRKLLEMGRLLMQDNCKLFLLDEPTAGLHPKLINRTMELIEGLKERGKAILIVEHNLDVVKRVAERIIFLDSGKIIAEGPAEEVLNDPVVRSIYLGIKDAA